MRLRNSASEDERMNVRLHESFVNAFEKTIRFEETRQQST